jgi:predicted DNA-binding protein
MAKKHISIRLDDELVKRMDAQGSRSDIIKKALEQYYVPQMSHNVAHDDVACLIEGQEKIIDMLEDVKRFQPVINLNYPQKMLPQISRSGSEVSIAPTKRWWQFWR